jgi:hypothetical protein
MPVRPISIRNRSAVQDLLARNETTKFPKNALRSNLYPKEIKTLRSLLVLIVNFARFLQRKLCESAGSVRYDLGSVRRRIRNGQANQRQ